MRSLLATLFLAALLNGLGHLGSAALRRAWPGLRGAAHLFLGLTLALGVLSCAVFWLGSLAGLSWFLFAPLVALLLWVGVSRAGATLRAASRGWAEIRALPRGGRWIAALLLLFWLLTYLGALAPPVSSDALLYHLTVPKLYAQEGRFFFYPWIWQASQPFLNEMLFTLAFLLRLPELAPLWIWAFSPLFALGTLALARPHLSRPAALLAAALAAGGPLVAWQSTSAFIELPLAVYTLAALVAIQSSGDEQGWGRGLWPGVFFGWALSSKMTGAYALAAGLVFLWAFHRQRPGWLRAAAQALALALLLYLPWALRSWLYTGNPSYPFLNTLFHSPRVTARMAEDIAKVAAQNYGFGKGLLALLLLPYRLVAEGTAFDYGQLIGPWPLALLIFLPALLWRQRPYRPAFFFAAAYIGLWFFGSQQARLLLPALPPLALLAVAAAAGEGLPRRFLAWTLALWLAAGAAISAAYCAQFLPVVLGAESREAYLLRKAPYHEEVSRINRLLRPSDKIYFTPAASYYLQIPFGGGPTAFQGLLDFQRLRTPQQVADWFKGQGFTHIYRAGDAWDDSGSGLMAAYEKEFLELLERGEYHWSPHRTLYDKQFAYPGYLFTIKR